MHPNPTGGIVSIELPVQWSVPVQLSVHDVLGKKIFSHTLAAGTGKTDVDLSACANGLYLVRLQTSTGVVVRRVFKH